MRYSLGRGAFVGAPEGADGSECHDPLSTQAKWPRRRSGADKQKQPAKKEVRTQRSRNRVGTSGNSHSPGNSNHVAANQHCHTFRPTSSAKTSLKENP